MKPARILAILSVGMLFCAMCAMAQLPTSLNLTRWAQPLPKPHVFEPVKQTCDGDHYDITMGVVKHQFHPSLPVVDIYGYGGTYPGGTFEAVVNRPVHVTWRNSLPEKHILPTEPLEMEGMHMENPPDSAGVVHLHGALIDPKDDGFSMDWITRGQKIQYHYTNEQLPLTMWYHDHVMTRTRVNVYAGLAGFYLLRDEDEHELGLPKGRYEMPLIIQDKILPSTDGMPFYPFEWGAFDGDVPVVNGKAYPYFEVKARAYRFRFLNGCNSRFLRLTLPDGPTFWQIGSDGGFFNEPVRVKQLTMGPAERADVIIDFYGYEGETITLRNSAPVPFNGLPGGDAVEGFREVMQFRVRQDKGAKRPYCIPSLRGVAHLPPLPKLDDLPDGLVEKVRDLPMELVRTPNSTTAAVMFLLNGLQFHDEPTETPLVDSTEVWNLINLTPLTHPIHLHLVQFRVLQRRAFNITSFVKGEEPQYLGEPRLPDLNEQGWKDTVRSNPGDVTTILVNFPKYVGWFVWHCHMLEHEDHDMMRPLVVLPRDGSPPPPPPGGHNGHYTDGHTHEDEEEDDHGEDDGHDDDDGDHEEEEEEGHAH
ncbi:twinarginine translocation pathway protein, putative [Acanthamoeba castellanii str. Neff]|uniref:Twinarginine translocation pathway protein, putative n=1 Tax=Acanthamoeba castellanii (strain ATCC 30010 / Neff) TaxID=1257118 RepID=L8HFQ2_ACACF|nr:twinarginine translocation pathway protein, putative [Acanthamoeba castellanii str. Neff]ELR23261.1 twinarginine translocation pathway protein, putative [Acanthamoeba castellanii str. Neff]